MANKCKKNKQWQTMYNSHQGPPKKLGGLVDNQIHEVVDSPKSSDAKNKTPACVFGGQEGVTEVMPPELDVERR